MNIAKNKHRNLYTFLLYLILPFIFYFPLFFQNGLWAPGDGLASYVPTRHLLEQSISNFEFPLWNSYINLGIPFHSDIQNSIFYLPNILFFALLPFNFAYNYMFLFHLTLAGFFLYLYLEQRGVNWKAAFLGGLVFMFCGTINAKLGHVTVQNAIVWTPLIFYFYDRYIALDKRKYIVFMALAFSMQILSGFIQISVYTAFALLIYMLFSLNKFSSWKKWLLANINFSLITIGFTFIQLYPTLLISSSVGRTEITYDYFTSYSLPLENLFTLLFPNILGVHLPGEPFNVYNQGYFGQGNLTEYALYIGVLPLVIALFAFKKIRSDRTVRVWAIIGLIAFIFALGSSIPMISKITYHIPLLNMFRVPTRSLFLFDLSIAILFAVQINSWFESNNKLEIRMIKKTLAWVLFISSGLIFSLHLILTKLSNYLLINYPDIKSSVYLRGRNIDQYTEIFSFNNNAVLIPIFLMILSIALLYFIGRKGLNKVGYALLTLLLLLDLGSFSLFHEKIVVSETSGPISKYLSEQGNDDRVWPIITSSSDLSSMELVPNTNFEMEVGTLNGYATFMNNSFKELLGFDERGFNNNYFDLLVRNDLISSLNTRYILISNAKSEEIEVINKSDINNLVPVASIESATLEMNGDQPSLVHANAAIQPGKIYKLTLKTKERLNDPVYVDLYGENYDSNEQQMSIQHLGGDYYEKYIYSGQNVPSDVSLRVFSFNKLPITVEYSLIEEVAFDESIRDAKYNPVFKGEYSTLYENVNTLEKLYSINEVVSQEDQIRNDIDYTNQAYVTDISPKTYSKAIISDIRYKNGEVKATITSEGQSFIVFSESTYPGWKAYIDGKEVDNYTVNGIVQGIEVPQGEHEIEFKYKGKGLMLGLILIILTILYSIVYCWSPRKWRSS